MTFPYLLTDASMGDTMILKLGALSLEICFVALVICAAFVLFRIRSPRIKSLLFLLILAKGVVGLAIGPVISLGDSGGQNNYARNAMTI